MTLPNWKTARTDEAFRRRMAVRSEIVFGIRKFFRERGFLEIETPTVVAHPGMEPNLNPLATEITRNDGKKFAAHLITSPEYSCKKVLAAGFERIFEMTRCYRNGEPFGGAHNPEFTMIEWYRANADYRAIMADTEQLVQELTQNLKGTTKLIYQGREIDVAAPWERLTVAEAMERHSGIDIGQLLEDIERFRFVARESGYAVSDTDSFDDIFFRIFLTDVEPKLGQGKPTILYEYPRQMAALSRLKSGDTRFAERFEAYACGLELCNAFSELNDADEQRRRLVEEQAERKRLGKEPFEIDEDFLEAVRLMPEAAGIALGVDRLVMLLTDASSISDVMFFPANDLF